MHVYMGSIGSLLADIVHCITQYGSTVYIGIAMGCLAL